MRPSWARRTKAARLVALGLLIAVGTTAGAQEIANLFAKLAPAVVRVKILTEETDENGKPQTLIHVSSGFFIDEEGRVLTAGGDANVYSRAVRKVVEWKGVAFAAELVGFDPRTSVALLQVLQLPEGFTTIPVWKREEPAAIGLEVLSLTTPIANRGLIELPPTPALGMITGHEGSLSTWEFPFTYLRADISRRSGDPGAVVVDLDGKLAGIVAYWVPEISSHYLVPCAALARMLEDFSTHQRVTYRDLPLEFVERENAAHTALEVVINKVEPGSSAASAGLQPNDVVRRIGTTRVERLRDIRDALFFSRAGEYARIEVERNGRRLEWVLPIQNESVVDIEDSPAPSADSSREHGESSATPPTSAPPPPRFIDAMDRAMTPSSE